MTTPALAVWLNSYAQPLRAALDSSAADGFRRVQINVPGSADMADFGRTARRDFARHLSARGLALDALAAEHRGAGLADPRDADRRLADLRRTLEMCGELKAPSATTFIAGFQDAATSELARAAVEHAAELAAHYGVQLAIETADADAEQAAAHIAALRCPNLGLAIDSARLPAADSPILAAAPIEAAFARDVRRAAGSLQETPFGEGDVDFPSFFGRLAHLGYRRSVALRCDPRLAAVDGLRRGREYLELLTRGAAR